MNARATLALFDVLRAHAFIRGENTLAVVCDRLFDEVGASLEASVVANGFALLPVLEIASARAPFRGLVESVRTTRGTLARQPARATARSDGLARTE